MDLLKSIAGFSLVILFSLALFIFMVRFIDANNPQQSLSSTDPFVNDSLQALQDRADELDDVVESSQEILDSAKLSPVFLFVILEAAFTVPIGFAVFLFKAVGTIFVILFTSLFGTGENPYHFVLGIIGSIVLITIVVSIIREIRTGRS